MSLERTLSIIKPDATSRNLMGKIIDRFEENGLKIVAGKLIHMDSAKAGGFYAEHKERLFFSLVSHEDPDHVFDFSFIPKNQISYQKIDYRRCGNT